MDHGHAWRLLIEGDDLPTFAHFTILRSVGEAAVTARWLVDEAADAQERARRAWGAQQQDLVERGRMEDLITRDGFDLPRGQGLLAKERMADLDAEARHAGVIPRKPLGVTDLFARYATPPDADLLGTGEALYRLLSAIAHGKPWALVPMARREWPAEEPPAGPIRLSIQLEVAALLTRNVLSLARAPGDIQADAALLYDSSGFRPISADSSLLLLNHGDTDGDRRSCPHALAPRETDRPAQAAGSRAPRCLLRGVGTQEEHPHCSTHPGSP